MSSQSPDPPGAGPGAPAADPAGAAARPLGRTLVFVALALVAAVVGAFVARQYLGHPSEPPKTESAAVYPEPRVLPGFALVAHDGRPFGPESLKGHWSILFFGFTNCPDVCPGTLTTLAAVRKRLADLDAADQPRVVMVSVDPKRDTPEKLAAYVPFFDRSFVGVTGEREAIDGLTRRVGVAVMYGPERDGAYTVDHTAALFLVGPDARLVAVFPGPHAVETIAADYRRIVAAKARR